MTTEDFTDFAIGIKNQDIEIQNKGLDKIIKQYSFVNDLFSSSNKNITDSHIIMIDQHTNANKKYIILGFNNTIIFLDYSVLLLDSIAKFFSLFQQNENLQICFLSSSAKDQFNEIIKFQYKEIELDSIFRNEISNFNKNFSISSSNKKSICQIFKVIKTCISGYLIKQAYDKLTKDRIKNLMEKTFTEMKLNIFDDDNFIQLRKVGFTDNSSENLIFYTETKKLFMIKGRNLLNNENQDLMNREFKNYCENCFPLLPEIYGKTNLNNNIVIEYIDGPTLVQIKTLQLTENDRITIIFELMIAIEYLHRNKHVYRDLKPNNVIIDNNKTAVLIDFDRMKDFDNESNKEIHTSDFQPYFAAPEVLNKKFSYKSDIYSLGKMMYYIMTNEIPEKVKLDAFEKYQEMQPIYYKCTNENEEERPSIYQLIAEFYLYYHQHIQINDFFDFYNDQLKNHLDDKTIAALKNLPNNENDPETQFNIGIAYSKGKDLPYNIDKSMHYLKLSADQNYSQAQYVIGTIFYEGNGVPKNIDEAMKYLEKSASQKNVDALVYLGDLYRLGNGVNQDYTKARKYYEIASEQNSAQALDCLGNMYCKGLGVKVDYEMAKKYYELSAEQNNADAIFSLGFFYYAGRVFKQNFVEARILYEKAAEQNYPPALNGLGNIYTRGLGVKLDMEKGLNYYQEAAKLHNANAFINLGNTYVYGRNVAPDFNKGLYYYHEAIKLKSITALHSIGNLYFNGHGVKQDYIKAKEYYEMAAKQNDPEAFNVLGHMYDCGKGVPLDYEKAKEYFEKAIEQNQPNACNNLGNMYLKGHGVTKDYSKAKSLFEKSANLGNGRAYFLLGNLYINGFGVEKSYKNAKKFIKKAVSNGYKSAIFTLGDLHFFGIVTEKNYKKAKKYYELAEPLRCTKANLRLGFMYYYGRGVEQDYEKAKTYFLQSAKENDMNAYFYLATMYEKGYGTEVDTKQAIKYYKLCLEKEEEINSVDYNQGWAQNRITNNKKYQSCVNCGLLYLFKLKDINLANKLLSEAGYSHFSFGKNNYGFFNLFFLNDREKANQMLESSLTANFPITEFHCGYIAEQEDINKSIYHYLNIITNENNFLQLNDDEIDDEQLYESNIFINCLTNLKLLQFYMQNKFASKLITPQSLLVDAVFRPLFSLFFYQDKRSYSFKFLYEKNDKGFILTNLDDFILNFPWYKSKKFTAKTEWKIINESTTNKRIIINVEPKHETILNDIKKDSNFLIIEKQIIEVFDGINKSQNNFYKAINQIMENQTICKNNDEKHLDSDVNEKHSMKKYMISSVHDNIERSIEYPIIFEELLIQTISQINDINQCIIKEMLKFLYTAPYPIIFGRIGYFDSIEQVDERKNISGLFYEGFFSKSDDQ